MQFLIVIYGGSENEMQKLHAEKGAEINAAYMKYTKELAASGAMKGGEALHGSARGSKITVREGRRNIIDGPFAEAKEVIGGFYLIDVKSREEAVEWAVKCPGSLYGTVELREVMNISM
jgi:hypothetical protein